MSIGYLFTLTSRGLTHRAHAVEAAKDKPVAPPNAQPAAPAQREQQKPARERNPR